MIYRLFHISMGGFDVNEFAVLTGLVKYATA